MFLRTYTVLGPWAGFKTGQHPDKITDWLPVWAPKKVHNYFISLLLLKLFVAYRIGVKNKFDLHNC